MIDLDPREIIATRHADDGRFVIFSSAGVTAGWPLPFWGVVADTGSDGHGLLVRLDAMVACDGWTVPQLLTVVHARLAAEHARSADGAAGAALACLDQALAVYADVPAASSPAVTFEPGDPASPYPWTVARCGPFTLPLCPDPESRGEGVTPGAAADHPGPDAARMVAAGAVHPARLDAAQGREGRPGGRGGAGSGRPRQIAGSRSF